MVRAGSFSAPLSVSPAAELPGRTVILGKRRQPAGGDGPPCEGTLLSVAGLGVHQRGTYLFPNPHAWTWCHRRLRTGYCLFLEECFPLGLIYGQHGYMEGKPSSRGVCMAPTQTQHHGAEEDSKPDKSSGFSSSRARLLHLGQFLSCMLQGLSSVILYNIEMYIAMAWKLLQTQRINMNVC